MSFRTALQKTRIRELKPSHPPCVESGVALATAIDSMRASHTGCVIVCEGRQVRGILTERDVLDKIVGQSVSFDSSIEQFMTRDPKTITEDDYLAEAIRLMDQNDYRHLPVTDKSGSIEGMISIQHIIDFLAELYPAEVLNLPPRQHQNMNSREGG